MNGTFDTTYVTYVIEGDILEAIFKKEVRTITLDMAKLVVAERLTLQAGQRFLLLIEGSSAIRMDKDTRDFFAGPAGIEGLVAIAMVVSNFVDLATATFLIKVQKPAIPTNFFLKEKDARAWLEKKRT
jgi:hypothetical protein